jgi:hypothetical protein
LAKTNIKCDQSHYYWLYQCGYCGADKLVRPYEVRPGGRVLSCGCYRLQLSRRKLRNYVDYTGTVVNGAKVMEIVGRDKANLLEWKVMCRCQKNVFVVTSQAITRATQGKRYLRCAECVAQALCSRGRATRKIYAIIRKFGVQT